MAQRIPSKWSYIVTYMGGHQNIAEECGVILRFTKKRVEIESVRKGKISLDYNDCSLDMQLCFERRRIVLTYKKSPESEGRIFLQLKRGKDENIVDVFNIYKKIALGLEKDIPKDSSKCFKFNFFKARH